MSPCLLQDPFQQYVEMSDVFCLSICTATTYNSTVGNEDVLFGFILGGGDTNKKVGP